MSQKAIRETDGKQIIAKWLPKFSDQKYTFSNKQALVGPKTNLDALLTENPWLASEKLAVKPDQLIKRRGKNDLLLLNATWDAAQQWLKERMGKPVTVQHLTGILDHFIVEPFYPHVQEDELYFAIVSRREGDNMLFYHRGGINVGDVDAVAEQHLVPIGDFPDAALIKEKLLSNPDFKCSESKKDLLAGFFASIFKLYAELHFAYLEMNPLIVDEAKSQVIPLDLAAKLDQTAEYEVHSSWGHVDWPAPFGRLMTPEEAYIHELDSKTGASLKLTILNAKGRVWTMVAGGGASVVYADTLADLGAAEQMANYGEYSGDPNETLTFEYAKTILDLMTRGDVYPEGKVLIIGGGIANFTNVAETFKGIVKALNMFRDKLLLHKVKIFVRRGGPNYQEGLKMMSDLGVKIGVPIKVFGPETHLTSIVPMALGLISTGGDGSINRSGKSSPLTNEPGSKYGAPDIPSPAPSQEEVAPSIEPAKSSENTPLAEPAVEPSIVRPWYRLFDRNTQTIVYGMQERAVQGMLDFDHICGREKPSVVGMVYPFAGNHFHKFYFGSKEILMPIFQNSTDALKKFPNVDCVINFASFRSVYESTIEILRCPQVRTVAIIAEGVPERYTRLLIKEAKKNGTVIIGPATVGGIKPGALKIGNTGGMLDNIMASKLYRPGSVAFVSKSGGMSNELNNIISRNSNGTCEGVAIGGDRYPGSTFIDHLLRFEADPEIKMMVLLGEVGGVDEYEICNAIKNKKITKPVVAWCIGTCASVFPYEVQFGHAGSLAHSNLETAKSKNAALREAGAFVPDNFDKFGDTINQVYTDLVTKGVIIEKSEPAPPSIPMDYHWAQKLGLIRKPSSFVSSISDERGEELIYAGMPISAVFQEDIGIGGVVGLLWFKRRLPPYACKFIEMVLVLTADHGPAVSGAHNTIVTARAGKDLISALVSGLCTIGPRFGGAIDGAAEAFSWAYDTRLSAKEFVETMKKQGRLIEGIGHRIKSIHNPDMRVTILKNYILKHFPTHDILDFALEVEKVTTQKKANLILNVDGTIGCAFVDLLRGCGAFTREEVDTQVKAGCLNGLFVLGRTIGFIGHYLDQVRLKQGLYRHPWDDISYISDNWF